MFEYTLDNGKRKFKAGLILFMVDAILGVIMALLLLIKNEKAQLAITIVFSIIIGVLSLFCVVFLIFGAVVYHAERTPTKTCIQLEADQIEYYKNKQKLIERRRKSFKTGFKRI